MYTHDMQSGGVVAIVPTYDGSDERLEPDKAADARTRVAGVHRRFPTRRRSIADS